VTNTPSEVWIPSASSQPRGAVYFGNYLRNHLGTPAPPTATGHCALRVSHPLNALLPTRSPGLISFRSRSWDSALQGIVPVPTFGPSRTPLTLMTFHTTAFVAALYLQGFFHRPSRAYQTKLFTRLATLPFLGSLSCEGSCPVSLPNRATTRV